MMRRLTSIVALDRNGAIGRDNQLPWRVKDDLRFFRRTTSNNIVIMGRRTFDSLEGCLPNRQNIVLTHTFSLFEQNQNCVSVGSIPESLEQANRRSRNNVEPFIVGGASTYEQFAPYVDRYLITEIDLEVSGPDTFFSADHIGPIKDWNFRTLETGVRNSAGNEANFRIFEITAKSPELFAERRRRVLADWQARRTRSSAPAKVQRGVAVA